MMKVLAVIAVYNEDLENLREILKRFPKDVASLIVIDDCSQNNPEDVVLEFGFSFIRHEVNKGIGAVIKSGIGYAIDNKYDIIVIMAGNGKDDPREIPKLLEPIIEEDYDYVQGSRNLAGGRSVNLPIFRRIMVRVNALIYRILTGFPATDAINGFRAYKLSIFDDPRINIWQDWLDRYELETYLHYKVLKLGYKVKEVPVPKIYQKKKKKYSHIRPFIDWWKIAKPLVYLPLGIKK
ncbi:TPA: hypothetical protein DCX16_03215 [bacterium]|nr:hypothetical protein [bacterium]